MLKHPFFHIGFDPFHIGFDQYFQSIFKEYLKLVSIFKECWVLMTLIRIYVSALFVMWNVWYGCNENTWLDRQKDIISELILFSWKTKRYLQRILSRPPTWGQIWNWKVNWKEIKHGERRSTQYHYEEDGISFLYLVFWKQSRNCNN